MLGLMRQQSLLVEGMSDAGNVVNAAASKSISGSVSPSYLALAMGALMEVLMVLLTPNLERLVPSLPR